MAGKTMATPARWQHPPGHLHAGEKPGSGGSEHQRFDHLEPGDNRVTASTIGLLAMLSFLNLMYVEQSVDDSFVNLP